MMSLLFRAMLVFGALAALQIFMFVRSNEWGSGSKSMLIGGIVTLILAIALPFGGMLIIEQCNGCGCEYFKPDMPDYCEKCGYALTEDAAKRFDCSCGAVYYSNSGEKFCTDCGTKIDYAANTNPTEETAKKFECECGMVYHADGGEKFCKDCGTKIVYGEE